MLQPIPVNYPAYAVTWYKATVLQQRSPESTDSHGTPPPEKPPKQTAAILVGGGGGKGKTGVVNRITAVFVNSLDGSGPDVDFLHETDTHDVPVALAVEASSRLLAAAINHEVIMYAIKPDGLVKLACLAVNMQQQGACVNSVAFAPAGQADGDSGGGGDAALLLATGGDDGVVRVWRLIISEERIQPPSHAAARITSQWTPRHHLWTVAVFEKHAAAAPNFNFNLPLCCALQHCRRRAASPPQHLAQACAAHPVQEPAQQEDTSAMTQEQLREKAKADRGKARTPQYPSREANTSTSAKSTPCAVLSSAADAPPLPPRAMQAERWLRAEQVAPLQAERWLRVEQVAQLQGHAREVCCVRWHPDADSGLLASASKDGTCRVWSWLSPGAPLQVLQAVSGLPPGLAPAQARMECRSCAFCPSGESLYTVQHVVRQAPYLTRWALQQGAQGGLACVPMRAVKAADAPVGHMALRPDGKRLAVGDNAGRMLQPDGKRLAVGDNAGRVTLFDAPALIRMRSYAAHDLPLVSLAFADGAIASKLAGYDLVCGSPDNIRVTLLQSQGGSLHILREVIKVASRWLLWLLARLYILLKFACLVAMLAVLILLALDHFGYKQSRTLL
ncbi:WD40-repeat-containing domain protein [Tribonema minus]|uniref:WD40-repeat-containing domain protein n=1 Tax=Tribonema minus TaxID=303371 RepID=A0A836CNG1_9STRA|nr:WD40-repeat-containing domain protein [Tribonema minus]